MKRVLCILEEGFKEIEAVAPIDLLRRAGAKVVLAAIDKRQVIGKNGIKITADAILEDLSGTNFDALLLPGGPAVMQLREKEIVLDLIRSAHASGKLIAAICAAPLLLHDAGILQGTAHTAHFSCGDELPEMTNKHVVLDGQCLTSRGAGTAIDFGLKLVEVLYGAEHSKEIASSIMA